VAVSNKIEITRRDHSSTAYSHQLRMDLLFTHIPFVVSRKSLLPRSFMRGKAVYITIVLEILSSWRKWFESWRCRCCSEHVRFLWYFPLAMKKLIDRLFVKFWAIPVASQSYVADVLRHISLNTAQRLLFHIAEICWCSGLQPNGVNWDNSFSENVWTRHFTHNFFHRE